MLELNRVERRALRLAALLMVLGAAVRLGCAPGPADVTWQPSAGPDEDLPATRDAVAAALAREERAGRPLRDGERIDPNRAPPEELRRLPGVGPARARAIVEARTAAPFAGPEDLLRVPGIGPASLARLRPYLALEAESRARAVVPGLAGSPAGAGGAEAAGGAGARLDVNRADTLALQRLPGIGPSKARGIVETRQRLGGFRRVEDLLEVPGIGPATLERLRHRVRVS